ncbi:head-tail joining protein [Bradyrhizobium sp. 613_E4_N2_2]|uniref:head-tail joining protein n=1 Tax=Bradyrhizobium sp. 613_E4_N2_2 TaxID=3240371 RepID=UPI003F88A511
MFFDVDDFATTMRVDDGSGTPRVVVGIFDEPYFDKQIGEYVQDTGDPRLTCKEVSVVGLKKHMACTIDGIPGVQFALLHDPKPDGQGTCTVLLKRM